MFAASSNIRFSLGEGTVVIKIFINLLGEIVKKQKEIRKMIDRLMH